MIVAILSESPSDEEAIRHLLVPLVGSTSSTDTLLSPLRSRGWPAVRKVLPGVVKHLHYRTIVDALVVIVDSDDSVPHGSHDPHAYEGCRLCRLLALLGDEMARLTPVAGRKPLHTAVGLCIPAIEAWYLCGQDASVTEAAWITGRNTGRPPYSRRELKARAYGSEIVTIEIQTQRAVFHAQRLAADLTPLHTWFPNGCGTMLTTVEGWFA